MEAGSDLFRIVVVSAKTKVLVFIVFLFVCFCWSVVHDFCRMIAAGLF